MENSGMTSAETSLEESQKSAQHGAIKDLDNDWEMKQLSTDKTFIITELKLYAKGLGTLSCNSPFKLTEKSFISNYCSVDLKPHNSVTLKTLMTAPHRRLEGKFFISRTIASSIQMSSLMIAVEIPDSDMTNRGVILSLHNYLHPEDELGQTSATFSPGTIVVVKNPMFTKTSTDPLYVVRSDNPADIVVLDDKECSSLLPGLEWSSGQRQNEEDFLILKTPCQTGWTTAKDWKSIAALRLGKKNYVGAIEAYTSALDVNPRDMEVLTQRCTLYLRLKMHTKSLQDSEIILRYSPFDQKAIFCKGTSLIGLGNYQVAIEFLEHHTIESSFITDPILRSKYSDLLLKAQECSHQQMHGVYDLMKIISSPFQFIHDCADYIGNITQCEIKGKGRGMIATKDIKCGDLILGAKAFEIAFADIVEEEHMWTLDSEAGRSISPADAKLNASIAHRLLRDEQFCKIFYNLYDGTKRSKSADAVEDKFVDMRRIDSIVRHNKFVGISSGNNSCSGIWFSASFFNNSCSDANIHPRICGNFLFLRASKNIFKGEELTLQYISCTTLYPERQHEHSKLGFVCGCSLCLLDSKDPLVTHIRRKEILREIDFLLQMNPMLGQVEALLQELQDQRAEHPQLNFYIVKPMLKLAHMYMEKSRFQLAASILWRLHCIEFAGTLNSISLQGYLLLMRCLIYTRNFEQAKKCAVTLKHCVFLEYGINSIEALNFISPDLGDSLVRNKLL